MNKILITFLFVLMPSLALASDVHTGGVGFCGVRLEFILFALTLLGVAMFHRHTMPVALVGLLLILGARFFFTDFGFASHLGQEWKSLLNLFGLLMGFELLAIHFEESKIPNILPNWLPKGWLGALVLLWIVFVMSSFLDNIAAAMIGGAMALVVFRGEVHIGYLAAIVAASNAGGAGSVVGDTTTTMLWIDGVSPMDVLTAYVGAITALVVCSIVAAWQQNRLSSITEKTVTGVLIDWVRVLIVLLILVAAVVANILCEFPAVGVWVALVIGAFMRKTAWHKLRNAWKGSVFLVCLVYSASLMPVETLPSATWQTSLGLGFLSAFGGSIPLTKLSLVQGGYDWGFIAYAVGFGGSMLWFGSSAGVALSNLFPRTRSVVLWVKDGWHVAVAYVVGFIVMLAVLGWNPHAPHKEKADTPSNKVEQSLPAKGQIITQ